MKINNNMIAKDLRFIGRVYKVLLGSIPKKKMQQPFLWIAFRVRVKTITHPKKLAIFNQLIKVT